MSIRRAMTWTGRAALVALAVLAAVSVWYVRAVQPQIAGSLAMPGLVAPVDVVRDREGVPHIYAASEDDALFALGVVHAQDRLWQMDLQRRIASGRVAEILGPQAIPIDVMMRTLGIRRTAEAMWARFTPAERAPFEAYVRGVNAVLAGRTGPLPPEFWLLDAPAPEAWTPVDCIGWTMMMAWDLSGNWGSEIARLRLLMHGLTQTQIDQFMPPAPGEHYPVLGDVAALFKPLFGDLHADADATARTLAAVPGFVEGLGSNDWVVAGGHSASGKPLLANDPHLGFSAPSLWYLAHLAVRGGNGLNVIGASLPGVPGIVLGRNDRIAWGFTNTGPDVQDLYIEKINPDDPAQYLTPEGWRAFDRREERIKIKGAPDRVLAVRATRHGPVVSDAALATFDAVTPPGHALAMAWTALSPDNRAPLALSALGRAQTWEQFVAGLSDFSVPQQNIVYADVDGNIGFIAPGLVPIRKPGNDLKGLYPAPGWDARYDWAGFIPFEALPQTFLPAGNPARYPASRAASNPGTDPAGVRGGFATANNKIVAGDYPYPITYEWAPPYRSDRITQLLAATPKHTLASFAAMQADLFSPVMAQALPYLLAAPAAGAKEQAARDVLARWDATMSPRRIEPTIATAWMRELVRLLTAGTLGPDLTRTLLAQRAVFVLNVLGDVDGAGEWCRRAAPASAGAACPSVIARALTLALADIEKRYGAAQSGWTWGRVHTARSPHRPFGNVPILARLFDLRVPVGGDTNTLNVAHPNIADEAEPFTAVHGAGYRALYDMADPEQSLFMQSTGQSGIRVSRLYGNLVQRWSEVRYIPMQTDRATVSVGALGVLRLVPRELAGH